LCKAVTADERACKGGAWPLNFGTFIVAKADSHSAGDLCAGEAIRLLVRSVVKSVPEKGIAQAIATAAFYQGVEPPLQKGGFIQSI